MPSLQKQTADSPRPFATGKAVAWFPAWASAREDGKVPSESSPRRKAPRPSPANQRGSTLFPLALAPGLVPRRESVEWKQPLQRRTITRGDPGRFIQGIGCVVEPVLDVQATRLVMVVPSCAAARFAANSGRLANP